MTLLFMDAAQGGDVTTKYRSTATGTRATATPRFTGGAYWHTASLKKPITASGEVIAGAAFRQPSGVAAPMFAFASDAGATIHVVIVRSTSLNLEARLGSTAGAVLATGTATLTASTWAQIEARCVVSDTVGVVEVRINGSATPDISFSGDTRNGGTSTNIDEVTWSASASTHFVTDIYTVNTSGSVNNTWMGDQRVVALAPTAQGFYTGGVRTPAGATSTNWSAVDEQPFVGGGSSDYVRLTGAVTDSYQFADLPAGTPSVAGLQVNIFITRDSALAQSFRRVIRIGGTDYLGASTSPATTYATFQTYPEVIELDPATSAAWGPATVDALDCGIRGVGANIMYASGISVEALILSFPPLIITIPITSSVFVDIPNEVTTGAVSSVTTTLASESAGPITVPSTSAVVVHELTTDYPRPAPSDPTLTVPDTAVEPGIERRSVTYPAPTLADGVPVNWEPT